MSVDESAAAGATPELPHDVAAGFELSPRGRRCRSLIGDEASIELLFFVFFHVAELVSNLPEGRMYLARELCDDLGWRRWFKGQRVCAGICLAHLVASGVLRLQRHYTPSGSGSKRYIVLAATRPES